MNVLFYKYSRINSEKIILNVITIHNYQLEMFEAPNNENP